MDRPEEVAKSVNPREQELSASEPSESNVPNEPMEALLRISKDMARVLDILTAPKAPIYTVRRHGKTQENSNFRKNDKIVISVKTQNFYISRMIKRTSPLESSHEI